jgi:hypothetical protein
MAVQITSCLFPPVFDLHGILILVLFDIPSAFFGALPVKPEQFPKDSRRIPEGISNEARSRLQ